MFSECEADRHEMSTPQMETAKRAMDLIGATLALAMVAPVLLLVSAGVYFLMGPPIIFRQLRPGLMGKPFLIYKFRTMGAERDQQGNRLADERRLTWLGNLLRRTSLDELPELFNVLRGEMSLVGPRPLLMDYLECYSANQSRRHEVKPGITGWAQIHGRNAITWERKFELDVWYVDHWSLLLDLKILWKTLWVVLRREGISAPSHATMPPFSAPENRTKESAP